MRALINDLAFTPLRCGAVPVKHFGLRFALEKYCLIFCPYLDADLCEALIVQYHLLKRARIQVGAPRQNIRCSPISYRKPRTIYRRAVRFIYYAQQLRVAHGKYQAFVCDRELLKKRLREWRQRCCCYFWSTDGVVCRQTYRKYRPN